jgi:hypothetical protein
MSSSYGEKACQEDELKVSKKEMKWEVERRAAPTQDLPIRCRAAPSPLSASWSYTETIELLVGRE